MGSVDGCSFQPDSPPLSWLETGIVLATMAELPVPVDPPMTISETQAATAPRGTHFVVNPKHLASPGLRLDRWSYALEATAEPVPPNRHQKPNGQPDQGLVCGECKAHRAEARG